jgi:predicted transcriptional regulator
MSITHDDELAYRYEFKINQLREESQVASNIIQDIVDERNQLYTENCELREALAEEQENKDKKYELKINQLELERMWWENLMENDWLSGNQKLVLYAIRHIIRALRYDWDQPTCEPVLIYNAELQNKTGLKKEAIIDATNTLDRVGLITKDTRGKGKANRTYYTLSGCIKSVEVNIPSRNHGGARCSECGSDNIVVKKIHKCLDCGHVEHF